MDERLNSYRDQLIGTVAGAYPALCGILAAAGSIDAGLVNTDSRVANGGSEGVWVAASRGAGPASRWIGTDFCWNRLAVFRAEAVVARVDVAGTPSELAPACQLSSPSATLGLHPGWSGTLAGATLDWHHLAPKASVGTVDDGIDFMDSHGGEAARIHKEEA